MNIEAITPFANALAGDADMLARYDAHLDAANPQTDVASLEAILSFATAEGFNFTLEDLKGCATALQELDDEALDAQVAGGFKWVMHPIFIQDRALRREYARRLAEGKDIVIC